MRISCMMLVGEHEPYLKYAIKSVKDIVDEIVFLVKKDSSSINIIWGTETKIVVQEQEETDFASWRNQALKECTGDWILFIDADEILANIDGTLVKREELEKIIKENPADAYNLFTMHFMWNYRCIDGRNDGLHFSQSRLFKNDGKWHWEGKIHERLLHMEKLDTGHKGLYTENELPTLPAKVRPLYPNPTIWHYGHCKGIEDMREKYAKTREMPDNPFREEHLKYKDNDEYCRFHPKITTRMPVIPYWGPHPRVLRLF